VPSFFGVDSFKYVVSDGFDVSDSVVVEIRITSIDNAPITSDDAYSVSTGDTLVVEAPGLLENDIDDDQDVIIVVLVDNVESGELELSGDGSFQYIPSEGFVGEDVFTYRASDGNNRSNLARVTIEVTP